VKVRVRERVRERVRVRVRVKVTVRVRVRDRHTSSARTARFHPRPSTRFFILVVSTS